MARGRRKRTPRVWKENSFMINTRLLANQNTYHTNVKLNMIDSDIADYSAKLKKVKALVVDNQVELLTMMAELARDLVADRINPPAVPELELYTPAAETNWAMERAATKIITAIRNSTPIILGKNRVGVLTRAELDAIKVETGGGGESYGTTRRSRHLANPDREMHDAGLTISSRKRSTKRTTSSPYDIAWMILEFGTGVYATPTKRVTDDGRITKVRGGGGMWRWGPFVPSLGRRYGPRILGQKPQPFLFETRENRARIIKDRRTITYAVANYISELLEPDS